MRVDQIARGTLGGIITLITVLAVITAGLVTVPLAVETIYSVITTK